MENYIQLLITLAIVVGGIVSAVNKSKRKAASQKASEQKNITRQTSGQGQYGRDGGQVSGKKSLAEMLRELAEEASGDTASPTVAPRPIFTPSMPGTLAKSVSDRSVTSREPQRQDASYMPEAVAYEAESLEAEYDGVDGARRRDDYNVEMHNAGNRYVGGESRGTEKKNGYLDRKKAAGTGARTHSGTGARFGDNTSAKGTKITAYAEDAAGAAGVTTTDIVAQENTSASRLAAILGGEFDLRRAIIETEILTPKYL